MFAGIFKPVSGSRHRVGKAKKPSKRSFNDDAKQRLRDQLNAKSPEASPVIGSPASTASYSPSLNPRSISMVVGKSRRLFGAHEKLLSNYAWFRNECRAQFMQYHNSGPRIIEIPWIEPEVFSAILEWMYKDDYAPRLLHDRNSNTWSRENLGNTSNPSLASRLDRSSIKLKNADHPPATIYHPDVDGHVIRDTLIYCAAESLGLHDLSKKALRKQGLLRGMDVATILRSARYAYAHTPESDQQIRGHFVTLIIKLRKSFLRSRTMREEILKGGTLLYLDVIVAMSGIVDGLSGNGKVSTPATTPDMEVSPYSNVTVTSLNVASTSRIARSSTITNESQQSLLPRYNRGLGLQTSQMIAEE